MGQVRSYDYLEAPEVEVLWRGEWCFGTLHEWRHQDGSWRGWVRFNVQPGENRIGTFNQDLIRPLIRRADEPERP